MPPQEAPGLANHGDEEYQSIYIVRHGDRWDYENPEVRNRFDSLPVCETMLCI